jgi:hypothetical protein
MVSVRMVNVVGWQFFLYRASLSNQSIGSRWKQLYFTTRI